MNCFGAVSGFVYIKSWNESVRQRIIKIWDFWKYAYKNIY